MFLCSRVSASSNNLHGFTGVSLPRNIVGKETAKENSSFIRPFTKHTMAANFCSSCTQQVEKEDEIVCNGFCSFSFHLACVDMHSELRQLVNSNPRLFWMCGPCSYLMTNSVFRQGVTSSNAASQIASEEQNKMLTRLKKAIDQNTAKINEILAHQIARSTTSDDDEQNPGPASSLKRRRVQSKKKKGNEVVESTVEKVQHNVMLKLDGSKTVDAGLPVSIVGRRQPKQPDPSKFWLYLSGFDSNSTEQQVTELVKNNLQIESVDVTKLVRKGMNLDELSFVSFMVGIDPALRDAALNSSTWQRGISFREFNFEQKKNPPFRFVFRNQQ